MLSESLKTPVSKDHRHQEVLYIVHLHVLYRCFWQPLIRHSFDEADGGENSDDYPNLLIAARKAVEFGYRVYMLPNPNKTRTPDFIFEKKGIYRAYDLKTVFGKSSVKDSLLASIGQCNRVLLNIQLDYNTRSLAFDIKNYFEVNDKAVEVLVFKGRRHFSIRRFTVTRSDYMPLFRKLYER